MAVHVNAHHCTPPHYSPLPSPLNTMSHYLARINFSHLQRKAGTQILQFAVQSHSPESATKRWTEAGNGRSRTDSRRQCSGIVRRRREWGMGRAQQREYTTSARSSPPSPCTSIDFPNESLHLHSDKETPTALSRHQRNKRPLPIRVFVAHLLYAVAIIVQAGSH